MSQQLVPLASLAPLPIIKTPIEHIAMDFVGPLAKTARGALSMLVILDYATRYPEAVPLWNMTSTMVSWVLMRFFAQVGLPREIFTDQGAPFTSVHIKQLCKLLQLHQIFTSAYHPQTDGLVERVNQTLKMAVHKVARDHPRQWEIYLDLVLFAIREMPQASTRYAPFELVSKWPRGILQLTQEQWAQQLPDPGKWADTYVWNLAAQLEEACTRVHENLKAAQDKQKQWYEQGNQDQHFQQGDLVLVNNRAVHALQGDLWQEPFPVVWILGPLTYRVWCEPRCCLKHLHVNGLKRWHPFRLHEAAASFQQLVDKALGGCQTFARAYLDDIIIDSPNWMTHLQHLEAIFHALQKAGLKANPKKSKIWFQELRYMGFLVGKGQIKPLPKKVMTSEQAPRPTTKRHLWQFLGLVGYYSQFIPYLAHGVSMGEFSQLYTLGR